MIEVVGDENDEKLIKGLLVAVKFLLFACVMDLIPLFMFFLNNGLNVYFWLWAVLEANYLGLSGFVLLIVGRALHKLEGVEE